MGTGRHRALLGGESRLRTTAVLFVIVVLIVAAALGGYYVGTRTNLTVVTTSETVTTTATIAETAVIPTECINTFPPHMSADGIFQVNAGRNASAVICVQFYYFSSSPINLTTGDLLSIQGDIVNGTYPYDFKINGDSNFTISVSQNQLILGGPLNNNEGTVIEYRITAKQGTSGTYELRLYAPIFGQWWWLGPQLPTRCAYDGVLTSGDGKPNYVHLTTCITYITTGSGSATGHTLPGIPYPLLGGAVYFREVGVNSST